MNKTEQKAYDRMIKEAAHDKVIGLFNVAINITNDVYLDLCKEVYNQLGETIKRLDKEDDRKS